ncbi:MAG TPA: hypothetical protein VGO47_15215 [Chlamydiales bacterium]|jgi:hypothetical protein|nr:hypothetical protein [Chlamydiales bacterium]
MPISINIHIPEGVITQEIHAPKLGSENVKVAAQAVFHQEKKETESPSLEDRVRDLSAKMIELSPDEIEEESDACEQKLNALLAQVRSVKFFIAFPIVAEIEGGSR